MLFRSSPSSEFWSHFPSMSIPESVRTLVNVSKFVEYVNQAQAKWSVHQKSIAATVIDSLVFGACPEWSATLPPLSVENAPSVFRHGRFVTDTIVSWIKKKNL